MGSLEGAQAVLRGDRRIHVWSPASALYKDVFLQEWQVQHGGDRSIVREENLALSPMVLVMSAERYEAFAKKYGEVSFKTLSQAQAPGRERGMAGDRRQARMGAVQAGPHPPQRVEQRSHDAGADGLRLTMARPETSPSRTSSIPASRPGPGRRAGAEGERPLQQHRQPDAGDGAERSLGLRRRGGRRRPSRSCGSGSKTWSAVTRASSRWIAISPASRPRSTSPWRAPLCAVAARP